MGASDSFCRNFFGWSALAAFDNAGLAGPLRTLIDKVAKHAYNITDEDIAATRASGHSEDQIFELIVCAASFALNPRSRCFQIAWQAMRLS